MKARNRRIDFVVLDKGLKHQVLVEHYMNTRFGTERGFLYTAEDVFRGFNVWSMIYAGEFGESDFVEAVRAMGIRVENGVVYDLIHISDCTAFVEEGFVDDSVVDLVCSELDDSPAKSGSQD